MNKNKIPKLFSGTGAKAQTVGQLIKQLEKLPKSLPVMQGYPTLGCKVVVSNVNWDSMHLTINDCDY